jgi:catechol 2,3-dioxygenase-like lactoylglutathione lyase family enzyme
MRGILETVLYCAPGEREAAERFYADVLGLAEVARWPDGTSYRVGPGVLLIFDRERLEEREGPIAEHGTPGPGHACFLAEAEGYDGWRERLKGAGTEVTHEHEWPSGLRSFYFRDPAGNLLEIANGDLWPR